MAQILRVDGTTEAVEPKNGKDFKLIELQNIVGGFIEIVYLKNKKIMVMDEEGKLKDKLVNHNATLIYKADRTTPDWISGDVLVCDQSQVK